METALKEKKASVKAFNDIFKRCAERASGYDREDRFFTEDLEELKQAGYLTMPVPEELGGFGLNLHEVSQKQRQLAYHAAPTALAINMHLYWVGVAADLWRQGDTSLEWILLAAAKGEIFAAGHGESGNHLPLVYSTTKAEKVKGGYKFTGHKVFSSLSPVWTFLGIHGIDDSDPENPKVVHAFMPRETPGFEIKQTWNNVLGMRATKSEDTILNGAFVPDKYVVRVLPAGFKGADGFLLTTFAWVLMGFGNIYCGLAENAFDKILTGIQNKRSLPFPNGMKNHPYIQNEIAKMYMKLETIKANLDAVTSDWANGVDHGPIWTLKLINAKRHAVENAFDIVRKVFELTGGYSIFPASGIERLYRDASVGILHPASAMVTEEITGGALCGTDLDAQPRWG